MTPMGEAQLKLSVEKKNQEEDSIIYTQMSHN